MATHSTTVVLKYTKVAEDWGHYLNNEGQKTTFCLKHINNCGKGFMETSGPEIYFTLIWRHSLKWDSMSTGLILPRNSNINICIITASRMP